MKTQTPNNDNDPPDAKDITSAGAEPRVESVDAQHKRWDLVLQLLEKLGQRGAICFDEDGWLPARQRMLVAFVDDIPAAHVSFHIHAGAERKLEAHLDAVGFTTAGSAMALSKSLREAALQEAKRLRCDTFRGIDEVKEPVGI